MITRSTLWSEYVEGLWAVALDSYSTKRKEGVWKEMCTVKKSKKSYEEDSVRSDLGLPSVKGEGAAVTFGEVIGGAKQRWSHKVWALAVKISEEAISDNLYEFKAGGSGESFKEIFKDLAISMSENEEILMARFLVNGATTTYHTTREDKALFATDHPRLNGSTFSNKATSADLTYTAFWDAIIAAENQFTNQQNRIVKKIEKLWIPPQLERKALEILKSTDRPDTANRSTNAYAQSGRNIKLVVHPYLTDTDAWYLMLDGEGIVRFDNRPTRFAKEGDFLTGDTVVKADQRWSAEIRDERSWYGIIPA